MNRLARMLLSAVFALALSSSVVAADSVRPYSARKDVRQFIAQMVQKHGFARQELRALFRKARFQPAIIAAITPPSEARARSWQDYRAIFLTPRRIEAGVAFSEREHDALARAAAIYGVPEEIIVGIIGVETAYGRNTGNYRVMDALTTLAFDYPPRAEFFRSELEHYLLYARDAGIDALSLKGSYAGAIGIPQFMPDSYRRYAVDLDGDGKQDLSSSFADAIGSVANFLKEHGWRTGEPIAFRAQVEGTRFRKLIEAGIKPNTRCGDLAAIGVSTADKVPEAASCALIELKTPGEASEYLVGLTNFYVITRYNRSSMYATAVFDLAQAVKSAATPANQAIAPSSAAPGRAGYPPPPRD